MERLRNQKTFFVIKDLIFEVPKPEITVRKVRIALVKCENEEYSVLKKNFDEDIFNIEKTAEGWLITEKDLPS